ncbi:MAG TPA: CDP-diacylglycerol--glycerol-3-phosphate 3-phosphatidyltransferase [Clostridiaceae bacterium]|nr:CDP-diacylglycerol--glycerol-3-phosphate 3-phosphatidyltransferase [Clostridiaceae bacterium]
MNLPNKITVSRIFLVPVFMLFILPFPDWLLTSDLFKFINPQLTAIHNFMQNYGHILGAVFFLLAASTDGIDGYIARKHKMVTKFGIFLDPIADKLIIAAALIGLVQRNYVTGWAAMVIIGREFIVTGLRLLAAGEGIVISAGIWGKIKMVTQVVGVALMLLDNWPFSLFTSFRVDKFAMWIAIFATIYSMFDYLKKNIKLIDLKKS